MRDAVQPFEVVEADGRKVATNGAVTLSVLDDLAGAARVFRRRAIKGMSMAPSGEMALPLLNQLAGDVLADLSMPAHVLAQRLAQIAERVQPKQPEPVEWAVAEIDGVRIYFDGANVVVTRQNLQP